MAVSCFGFRFSSRVCASTRFARRDRFFEIFIIPCQLYRKIKRELITVFLWKIGHRLISLLEIEKYFVEERLFSGVAYDLNLSGKLKSEWSIRFGLPHGKSVGYNEVFDDPLYEYSYAYNYEHGHKVGDQFEYFQYDAPY